MSGTISADALREALGKSGYDSELKRPDPDGLIERWANGLREFVDYYQQKFGERIDPFAWWQHNPVKARAFFQLDTLSLSPVMKAAVWRILLGSDVQSVHLDFAPQLGQCRLKVTLSSPYGEIESFDSNHPDDVKLIRHLGVITVNGRVELQGYHAFRR